MTDAPLWFAELGDIELSDAKGRVLLFPTEQAALEAGVAEFGEACTQYVYAVPAVIWDET